MPRRRALVAGALAGLLAGCGVSRRPETARWAPPRPVPAPDPSGTASPAPSATGPVPLRPQPPVAQPGGGNGPAGAHRLTGSDAIALTFDDGPDPEYTP